MALAQSQLHVDHAGPKVEPLLPDCASGSFLVIWWTATPASTQTSMLKRPRRQETRQQLTPVSDSCCPSLLKQRSMEELSGKHLHPSALQLKQTPEAPREARQELDKLGPMSTNEKITAGALGLTVALWIFGSSVGINAVAAALVGKCCGLEGVERVLVLWMLGSSIGMNAAAAALVDELLGYGCWVERLTCEALIKTGSSMKARRGQQQRG